MFRNKKIVNRLRIYKEVIRDLSVIRRETDRVVREERRIRGHFRSLV
jgi:hypothetical protein